MSHQSETSEARQREMKALRSAGLTYGDIGRKAGISGERARQIINGSPSVPSRKRLAVDAALPLRTADVARLLGIHPNTVRRWADEGSLKSYRLGKRRDRRFRPEDVKGLYGSKDLQS